MERCVRDIRQTVTEHGGRGSHSNMFFFDEIEELVTSRDDGVDRQARLATTMMLPIIQELTDLAREHRFMYFIATNHIERFDSAITRMGRIDLVLPLGPPDRQARFLFFDRFIRKTSDEMQGRYNTSINMQSDWRSGEESHPRVHTDLDILSRASAGLTMKDIEAVCRNAVESHIARFPSALADKTSENVAYVETRHFIDWINKYRTAKNSDDVRKFYSDRDKYSRSSALYTEHHTIQEKVEHEFNSLHIRHNLGKVKAHVRSGENCPFEFSFWNLSSRSLFEGRIAASVYRDGRIVGETSSDDEVVHPGRLSHKNSIDLESAKSGVLKAEFEISGRFILLGVGGSLRENMAKLMGSVTSSREIVLG